MVVMLIIQSFILGLLALTWVFYKTMERRQPDQKPSIDQLTRIETML
jgi:maltodextrin utilization protein YvdJ